MDKLLPELLQIVLDDLSEDGLSYYCTVSRQWQHTIEQITFRNLHVRSHDIALFAQALSKDSVRRLSNLWQIKLDLHLPTYLNQDCIDSSATSQAFSDSAQDFFRALHAAEKHVEYASGNRVQLHVQVQSVALRGRDEKTGVALLRLGERSLPENRIITNFSISYGLNNVMIEPAACIMMAAACKKLETCHVSFYDDDPWGSEENAWGSNVRMNIRSRISSTLQNLSQSGLRSFCIDSRHKTPQDENVEPDRLVCCPGREDLYSCALRVFSQSAAHLTNIKLLGAHVIAPSLFWPAETTSISLCWPYLQTFEVEIDLATPDGGWYFERYSDVEVAERLLPERLDFHDYDDNDDGEAEHDEDASATDTDDEFDDLIGDGAGRSQPRQALRSQFRTVPSKSMSALLIAMAKAARCMPALRNLSLARADKLEKLIDHRKPRSARARHSTRQFAVHYRAKGVSAWNGLDPEWKDSNRLIWCVGTWRPEVEVLEEWGISLGEHGIHMWEDFLHEKYGLT